jgi:hypothetical protein
VAVDEGYDQGTWEHIAPEPRKVTGRKDGRSVRELVDVAAFKRLLKLLGADVVARIRDAEKRQKKGR